MSRKSQISSRMFIYVLAIVVFSLLLLFGYKSIWSTTEKSEQARLIQLRTSLRYDIESLASDYGSTRMKEYELPSNIGEVCLIDLEMNTPGSVSSALLRTKSGIISDQIEGGMNNNLFVFDNKGGYVDSLDVGKLSIAGPGWICYKKEGGKLRLGLEGLGDKTGIIEEFSVESGLLPNQNAVVGIEEISGLELHLESSVEASGVTSVKLRVEKGIGRDFLSDRVFIEIFDETGPLDINNLVASGSFGDSFIEIPVSDCELAGNFVTDIGRIRKNSCTAGIAKYFIRELEPI